MSKYFTISIGSNGSIVLLNNGSKIVENYFFEEIENEDNKKILVDLFKKNKKLPVYFILDNIGQNYNLKTFSKVSFFDAKKIVNRKFKYDIPEDDLKEKRYLGYNKTEKEWNYMFISSAIDGSLKDWINFIAETDNILNGVYILPLESEKVLRKLKSKIKFKTQKNKNYWDIILVRNKVSGFREITFFNNRLVFTRILNEDLTDQEHFNTQFKENILRTIEYLKRFYSNFDDKYLNIYTIVDNEVKEFIAGSDVKDTLNIKNFSYLEFAGLFGLVKKLNKFLDCGDIIFKELIMSGKKIISFSTKEMKQLAIISSASELFRKFSILLFILLFGIIGFGSVGFVRNEYAMRKNKVKLNEVKKTLEDKKKQEFGDGIVDVDDIIDVTSFYIQIKNLYKNPFDSIGKFSKSVKGAIVVTNLKWKIDKDRKGILYGGKEVINLDSSLVNKSGKIDDLFKTYETIGQISQTDFVKYNVKMSNLPRNINFNTNYYSFPLKIDIVEK